jgi:uncharacterized protein YjbI with pentapeptide repeats
MVGLQETGLQECQFEHCKLLALRFDNINPFRFEVAFQHCQLNLSSFFQCVLRDTVFQECSLQEVDFSEADLSGAQFDKCDLSKATFDRTKLEGADFRTAVRFVIDPTNNFIRKAKFSTEGLIGLVQQFQIEVED